MWAKTMQQKLHAHTLCTARTLLAVPAHLVHYRTPQEQRQQVHRVGDVQHQVVGGGQQAREAGGQLRVWLVGWRIMGWGGLVGAGPRFQGGSCLEVKKLEVVGSWPASPRPSKHPKPTASSPSVAGCSALSSVDTSSLSRSLRSMAMVMAALTNRGSSPGSSSSASLGRRLESVGGSRLVVGGQLHCPHHPTPTQKRTKQVLKPNPPKQ
jgi:hypothetical protein